MLPSRYQLRFSSTTENITTNSWSISFSFSLSRESEVEICCLVHLKFQHVIQHFIFLGDQSLFLKFSVHFLNRLQIWPSYSTLRKYSGKPPPTSHTLHLYFCIYLLTKPLNVFLVTEKVIIQMCLYLLEHTYSHKPPQEDFEGNYLSKTHYISIS